MQALVSIITPSYNSGKFIAQTIRSVQQQTYQNWELLIVDDCSNDNTAEIVSGFLDDSRIRFTRLQTNSGAGIARSTALSLANGRYVAFLDSDDAWKPEKLERQLAFMAEHRQPFTFSFYECMDEDGEMLGRKIEAPRKLTYTQLFFCNFVGNLTGIYDTDYFGKIEIPSIRKRQDWIVWLTILKQLKSAHPVPESLAFYRVRKDSISASKWNLLKHNYVIYRNYHKKNAFVALCCMAGFLIVQLFVKPSYVRKI